MHSYNITAFPSFPVAFSFSHGLCDSPSKFIKSVKSYLRKNHRHTTQYPAHANTMLMMRERGHLLTTESTILPLALVHGLTPYSTPEAGSTTVVISR